ncbi:GNAT family N-acetyltransferase [Kordiimonas marina]|uniref:GNAT family N-acetyltransferase n=1 Tax=Kordiimonas marina TaxID=2872312 RepID=UPI001FF406EB|nr:GNAT family N-acetyltransferase [Kordiimonas marina]MCJ9429891.1 GNAT family N-acetyltransferase [Kordiimonas marina]
MVGDVTIRLSGPADRPACVRMMAALNTYENAFIGDRLTDLASADTHMTFLEEEAVRTGGFTLVAEEDGAVIGFLVCFAEAEEGSYVKPEKGRYGFISDLYLVPEKRGQGIAQALLKESEDRCRALGLADLRISALVANTGALRAYEKFGFRPKEIVLAKPL